MRESLTLSHNVSTMIHDLQNRMDTVCEAIGVTGHLNEVEKVKTGKYEYLSVSIMYITSYAYHYVCTCSNIYLSRETPLTADEN